MQSINNESDLQLEGVCAIKFSATWCGPCKHMEPTVEKLANEFSTATFLAVDIDEAPELVQKYKIRTLPTLVIIKDGQEVERVIGSSLLEPLRKIFRTLLNVSESA